MAESEHELGDPIWELKDPTPDVQALFVQFDEKFFGGQLKTRAVGLRWSKKMYSCAGKCYYKGSLWRSKCEVVLSEPLLKLRPRVDLVQTLLHEMIHAFLFVVEPDSDHSRDGHGPTFIKHMHRINAAANLNISIYHNFHDEVKVYKTHWWRCNGPCRTREPYFGIIRRTNNRAPGPSNFWWARHQKTCGGQYVKIKEPETKQKSAPVEARIPGQNKKRAAVDDISGPSKIMKTISAIDDRDKCLSAGTVDLTDDIILKTAYACPVCDNDFLGTLEDHLEICVKVFEYELVSADNPSTSSAGQNVMESVSSINDESDLDESREYNPTGTMYPCPCCLAMVEGVVMNEHIDECLNNI